MKNIKLKYFAFALMMLLQWSCAKTDIPEATKKESEEIINSLVFNDDIREYVLDGKTVTDHQQIADAAKKAWNVHYDYPNEKVVISTTPKVFDSYQNSNTEFKQALEQNAKAVATNSNNEETRSAKVAAVPAGAPPSIILAHQDKSMIGFSYEVITPRKTTLVHDFFIASSDADLTSTRMVIFSIDKSTGVSELDAFINPSYNFNNILKSTTSLTNFRCYMNNESRTASLTKTFYEKANYTGPSLTVTAAKNTNINLINIRSTASGYLSFR
jgi:hypothetical protein